jgi:hypothetical protein
MKYNLLGSALVLATTLVTPFAQGAPAELNSTTTSKTHAIGASHGKNIVARNIEWSNDPTTGEPYVFKFNEQTREGARRGAHPTDGIRFVIKNGDPRERICTNIQVGDGRIVPDPYKPGALPCLDPGQSLEFGNVTPWSLQWKNNDKYNAGVRGWVGCDDNGYNCAGDLGTESIIEFTVEPQGKKQFVAINLSNRKYEFYIVPSKHLLESLA